ncbi:homeobox protein cut isoform X6 [Chrysoperla carnea]|uniref:homeobox protein cut isoform X6 n=1 Tax=Chrysoperla carnea TaxID=189513 RepID=UPI001D07B4A9|nr:homeobox protein cut isoform X6 [Chrysoperla carnea]
MQPTATASVPAPGEMDLQALQSMDWLFKKERFHLLAQFWQHVSVDDRATLAEKENASLKEQLINNANSGDHKDINNMDKENNSRSNLEVEVATKDKEIVQLIEQVHRLQSTLQSIKETSRTQIQRLEEQLEHNRQHINRLESRLDQQRDYDDIKREINILRSVDLSVVNQHNENKPPPSLELLLLERQKAAAAAVAAAAAAAAASAAIVSETNNNTTTSSNNTTSTVALSPILTTATTPATTTSSSLTSSTPSNLTSSLLKPPSTPETPGKDTGMPTYGGRESSDMNEERIAHILNEASHLMKVEDTHSNDDSKSPSHGQCPSPFSKESSQNRKLKKYENDDIPQEKVLRIYQEELAKLMGRRMEDMRNTREPFTNLFFPHLFSGGVTMDRNQEEMRIAMEAYHRELAKLNQCPPGAPGAVPNLPGLLALQQQVLAQQNHLNGAQDLSLPKEKSSKIANGTPELMESQQQKEMMQKEDSQDPTSRHSGSAFSLVRPKIEPGVVQSNTNSSAPSPLGNSILPPAMTPTDEFSGAAAASPLQRMASITNSLISQPPTQSHHSPSQRPLKAVLPPITQQQFDLFNNLNTEDIVKKVKEQLSQYSISQRLFGESVLGLSQGSVSDLLARPKPWHMLTQKGREPFIRMKMFLEDDNAVHKLVASQYKIAPEKLMRTGGYGGSPCTSMTKPPMPPQAPKMMSEAAGLLNKIQQENHSALLPPSLQLGPPTSQPNMVQPPPPPMMLTPPGIPPHHPINLQNPEQLKKSQSPHPIQHSPMGQQQSSHMRSLHQHISPSVYEMAALTQDLDTQTITTKIKEALLANNIGQKIFGEAVLGLSQGSVSELLSKPKPWHMLSIKGREPFIRMQLWLSDAHNIDRLQALKNERREANKRRRSTGPGAHDNSSDTSSNDTSEFYHSNSPGPGPGPPSAKKQRVLFSEEQKEALRLAFHLDPYPNVATIEFLAAELNLSSRTITNWFHNHRMRLKQQSPHGVPNDIPVRDQSGNQPPFDPVQFRLLLNQRLLELQKERIGLGAVPLPYPPYFATNTNLAALISRGLLPTGDVDLSALNNAVKEEMSGLDLSMTSLKREPSGEYDDEDCESNVGSEVSNISGGSLHGDVKPEPKELPIPQVGNTPRSSRRKPAAPQWVKPDWQEEPKDKPAQPPQPQPTGNEVIINGVCVMQTEDYGRLNSEETVRVEPTPVMDRFDDRSDASSVSDAQETESIHENESPRITSHNKEPEDDENHDRTDCPPPTSLPPTQSELPEQDSEPVTIKTENEDERWDY